MDYDIAPSITFMVFWQYSGLDMIYRLLCEFKKAHEIHFYRIIISEKNLDQARLKRCGNVPLYYIISNYKFIGNPSC